MESFDLLDFVVDDLSISMHDYGEFQCIYVGEYTVTYNKKASGLHFEQYQ